MLIHKMYALKGFPFSSVQKAIEQKRKKLTSRNSINIEA